MKVCILSDPPLPPPLKFGPKMDSLGKVFFGVTQSGYFVMLIPLEHPVPPHLEQYTHYNWFLLLSNNNLNNFHYCQNDIQKSLDLGSDPLPPPLDKIHTFIFFLMMTSLMIPMENSLLECKTTQALLFKRKMTCFGHIILLILQ